MFIFHIQTYKWTFDYKIGMYIYVCHCVFMLMQALTLYNLKNLNLKNLRVRNAQQIQISIEKCNNVSVKNVEITVLGDSPNTDGIHITNTQNIRISNSDIGTGNDDDP